MIYPISNKFLYNVFLNWNFLLGLGLGLGFGFGFGFGFGVGFGFGLGLGIGEGCWVGFWFVYGFCDVVWVWRVCD